MSLTYLLLSFSSSSILSLRYLLLTSMHNLRALTDEHLIVEEFFNLIKLLQILKFHLYKDLSKPFLCLSQITQILYEPFPFDILISLDMVILLK